MKIPAGWHEVNIAKFQALTHNASDNSLAADELLASNISVLCDTDYDIIAKLPLKELNEIGRKLLFIGEPAKNKAVNEVIIGKQIYKLQPDISQMPYGQFKDLTHYTKKADEVNDNLHFIMALFLYPDGTTYDKGFQERAELFKQHLTMDVVFPLSAFFFELLKQFVKVTQHFTLSKAEAMIQDIQREIGTETK